MTEIQKHSKTYESLNTKVAALSTDTLDQSAGLAKKLGLSFSLLCDVERNVIDRYNLRNPFEHDGIAYPSTFIINPEGRVCYRSMDGTGKRLDISGELAFLQTLNEDSATEMQTAPRKKWIFLSFKELWWMVSNLATIGNRADWKHFFLAPVSYLKILWNRLKK